jgi:hypothetical protein
MTRRVPSTSTGECPAIEFASKYSAQLHRRSPDRRSLGDGTGLIAIQLPTQPSDRLNVPAPVFPDNRPTALRVMPFPGFGVAKSPRGRAVRRQARPNIFENCEACCGFLRCAISSKCRITRPRWRSAPLLPERNLAHGAGMTLQFVRPDIRQSCILLAAVKSWASHSPSARIATAIASPAIAPRRFPPCSGSVIARSVPETVDMKHPSAAVRYYHDS